jgi:acyl dehydratase
MNNTPEVHLSEYHQDGPTAGCRVEWWEDVAGAPPRRYGPLTVTGDLLDRMLDLTGEHHPLHHDPGFAAAIGRLDRVVPGGLIHSITSGWVVRHGSPMAVIGLRSMSWDFVRPLYIETAFWFTTTVDHAECLDDRTGLVNLVRKVTDEANRTHAIGRLSAVLLRRGHGG